MKPVFINDELREQLNAQAAREYASMESIVAIAVEPHLEAIKTWKFFEERGLMGDTE